MKDVELTEADRAAYRQAGEEIEANMARLRAVVPTILDLSFREATLSAAYGHTLEDKKELYRLAKSFGFQDFALPGGLLDFPVDIAFLNWLVEAGTNLDGFFGTAMLVPTEEGKALRPNRDLERFRAAKVPNVILVLETWPSHLRAKGRSRDQTLCDIERNVAYVREWLPAPDDRRGRINARIVDIFDAFDEDPEFVTRVLKLLGALPIWALMFEDVRGTHFPFHTRELVKLMRRYLPPPRKIIAHPHSSNGMENASALETVLAGGDGIWAGFTPQAAQGAHASSLMLLTNLLRAGNQALRDTYRFEALMKVAERMWYIHDGEGIDKDHPVVGERAYRYIDPTMVQTDRPCDLDPRLIGREPGYRVTPAWAPEWVIGHRLAELGYDASLTDDANLLREIRRIMGEAQMAGLRIRFDDRERLAELVAQAERRLYPERKAAASG
jgi:isopropylmalate/homocitrate/citramalate synthase